MSQDNERTPSSLRDEATLRWAFLEDEADACAVVSDRMELVYINRPGRELVPDSWFGKRCFEVLPTVDESCALHCPTIQAVHESVEIRICEETLEQGGDVPRRLEVAVLPVPAARGELARAVLLMRPAVDEDTEGARETLVRDAGAALERICAAIR